MKKRNKKLFSALLLFTGFTLIGFSGCGEEPTLKDSPLYHNSWATLSYGFGSYHIVCGVETQYNFFDGDSVFNNKAYKKMYCYKDEQHSTRFYEGLIRENNSKIFIVPKDATTEYLLYDFSVTEGTSFEYADYRFPIESRNMYVKQVDYVNINGKNVKRIQFSLLPPYDYKIIDIWYEGVGSEQGFLYPFSDEFTAGGKKHLLCCTQNYTLVYQNSKFPNCYYDNNVETILFLQPQPNIGVSVYPNPVDSLINISLPEETILYIRLYDVSAGQVVYSNNNINTNSYTIDVSLLQKGFYALTVFLNSGIGGDFIIYKL